MSSYLLPYDTLYNLWMTSVPIYEWEPVPPAAGAEGDDATAALPSDPNADGVSAAEGEKMQPMRLVHKGTRWVLVPVSSMRENTYFNQMQDSERDDDERRAQARKAAQPRPQLPADNGVGPAEPGPAATASDD